MVRGNAVVVVNETDKPREGTNVDKDNLMSIINILGFQCINVKDSLNVSSTDWQHEGDRKEDCDCLSCRIKTSALNDGTDCFLFAITTHGGEKEGSMELQFSDKKKVELKSIVDVLNSDCLRGKKKILIVQVCRSSRDNAASADDPGVSINIAKELEEVQIDPERTINDENPEDENQGATYLDLSDGILPSFLPANFIVVYACWSGRIAQFSKKEGSWLVTDLKKQIDNHFEENTSLGFLQILTQTVASVAERETVCYKRTEDKKKKTWHRWETSERS
ncbi:CASP6-like protein [Mya arenaria]|uniref:CASP6-like protein n=2 Tax=Mya arenaria TaxID=6604 RepID=A0ABY7FCU7_MYAAR|nr:caspase-1-like isoform X2 [Mya arenaria]XP_052766270.1 caspase-1-like isoform X2 [Mya arenaria]WAR19199.1 CASP6-like protein [Mya arenaria]